MSLTVSKQHNYDFNSVEEIISCAAKTGLSLDDMTSRLGVTSVEYIKWQIECRDYGRRSLDDSSESPTLEVSQERLDSLAEYCRVQGIFPLVAEKTSKSSNDNVSYPQYGRSDDFRDEMITAWRRFIDEHGRHPSSNELISLLEMRSNAINKTEVNYQSRTISIHSKIKGFGNSKQPFEQIYYRIKKKVLQ